MSKSNIFLSFLPHKNHPNHKLKPEVNSLTVSNSTLLEDNKKMIKEYLTKTKFSSPKFLNNVSSQNHNSNYFSLSKNKIDNSKSGYLISSLKIDGKPEISIPTITKNLNHCDIQINIQKEKIRFNVDCANKTSNSLVEILFVKIKEFYQQSKKNSELNQKPIIGFSTSSGFILIDYILTLNNIKLEFLQNMIIVFNPIYADIHFLKMKSTRISLKHFEFLKLIGSGGFSKVFLGL